MLPLTPPPCYSYVHHMEGVYGQRENGRRQEAVLGEVPRDIRTDSRGPLVGESAEARGWLLALERSRTSRHGVRVIPLQRQRPLRTQMGLRAFRGEDSRRYGVRPPVQAEVVRESRTSRSGHASRERDERRKHHGSTSETDSLHSRARILGRQPDTLEQAIQKPSLSEMPHMQERIREVEEAQTPSFLVGRMQ